MNESNTKLNPIQLLFKELCKIVDLVEIKDLVKAKKCETDDSDDYSQMWINAIEEFDNYITYKEYWNHSMFRSIDNSIKSSEIKKYIENPYNIPLKYRDNLLIRGREEFLNNYEEKNEYYRTLIGLPPLDCNKEDYVYLSKELCMKYNIYDVPVHELPELIQNDYMKTEEYKNIIESYPSKSYLKYLGMYKVDLYRARKAKDFDIIRYPDNSSGINPYLLKQFSKLYEDYREYVMVVLYNNYLENLYKNYRTFVGMIIIFFVFMQIGNSCVESINTRRYLDDSMIYDILNMYGIPESLVLTTNTKRNLAVNLPKLIREKGTNNVYDHIVDILGYQDITVNKLMLMRGQIFDENDNFKVTDSCKPYFVQVNIDDPNPYKTLSTNSGKIFSYDDIISGDPTWWDLDDVRDIISRDNYTLSDSKYITLESIIHQMKYIFESIYFVRLIIDNKLVTDTFNIQIPKLFGIDPVSVYDIMIFLTCANCLNRGFSGDIINTTIIDGYMNDGNMYNIKENGIYKEKIELKNNKYYRDFITNRVYRWNKIQGEGVFTDVTYSTFIDRIYIASGFNFDLDITSFMDYIDNSHYIDKDRIRSFLSDITISNPSDINRVFNNVIIPMREWLEEKIIESFDKKEYNEYENLYKALFTYDAENNNIYNDFKKPIEIIKENYHLYDDDMLMLKYFYPHKLDGDAVTITKDLIINDNGRYMWPFLNRINVVDWYVHIVVDTPRGPDDRGYLYFYDVINCDDVRKLTNPNGTRIFMDYEDNDIGWQLNMKAVDEALRLINAIPEDQLKHAYFQISTPIRNSNGEIYYEGQQLSSILRSGIVKNILIDKIKMDIDGLSDPPVTYFEYLRRKNKKLYSILMDNDRFNNDKESWMNDIQTIILELESSLDIQLKYFEYSIIGEKLFFDPLITLIRRFKSKLVDFAKTGIKQIFDDKMDSGGNINILRIFDTMDVTIRFITVENDTYESTMGFYDVEPHMRYHLLLDDRYYSIKKIYGSGYDTFVKKEMEGSIGFNDELKLIKNGKII